MSLREKNNLMIKKVLVFPNVIVMYERGAISLFGLVTSYYFTRDRKSVVLCSMHTTLHEIGRASCKVVC